MAFQVRISTSLRTNGVDLTQKRKLPFSLDHSIGGKRVLIVVMCKAIKNLKKEIKDLFKHRKHRQTTDIHTYISVLLHNIEKHTVHTHIAK